MKKLLLIVVLLASSAAAQQTQTIDLGDYKKLGTVTLEGVKRAFGVNLKAASVKGIEVEFDGLMFQNESNFAVAHFKANCVTYEHTMRMILVVEEGKPLKFESKESKKRSAEPDTSAYIAIGAVCKDKVGLSV